jgi:hypothetical protein
MVGGSGSGIPHPGGSARPGALAALTAAMLGTGLWWFVAGAGERRFAGIPDARFSRE